MIAAPIVLKEFTVVYVQEVTQVVRAHTLADAGSYAKKYANHHKDVRVLSVHPAAPRVALPPP